MRFAAAAEPPHLCLEPTPPAPPPVSHATAPCRPHPFPCLPLPADAPPHPTRCSLQARYGTYGERRTRRASDRSCAACGMRRTPRPRRLVVTRRPRPTMCSTVPAKLPLNHQAKGPTNHQANNPAKASSPWPPILPMRCTTRSMTNASTSRGSCGSACGRRRAWRRGRSCRGRERPSSFRPGAHTRYDAPFAPRK